MPEELSAALSRIIRERVAKRGWSQREFARRMNVSPSVASYKLAGTRSFDVPDLSVVAEILETTATELVGQAEREAQV